MKRTLSLATSLMLAASMSAFAQPALAQERGHEHQQGHENRQPPPPPQRHEGTQRREVERLPNGRTDNRQHVGADGRWYGDRDRDDRRFRVTTPWIHGRFESIGPSFRFNVVRFEPRFHRFFFPGGFGFEVAAFDWPICANWCWDCGDNFVVYDDPDHPGWYLLYNLDTGTYVHVSYLGIP